MQNSSNVNEQTLIVAPQEVDCVGIGPRKCLRAKKNATDEWRYFYNYIDGFNFEPGYEYVLRVKTEKIANPPADTSSIKYTLLEQISKTKMWTKIKNDQNSITNKGF